MTNTVIEGFIDHVSVSGLDGWAYRTDQTAEHLKVAVQIDGVTIAEASASQYRSDLQEAGIGAGDYAFYVEFGRRLSESQVDAITVIATAYDGRRLILKAPADAPERVIAEPAPPPRATSQTPEQTVDRTTRQEESTAPLAPVGYPVDFLDDAILDEAAAWTGTDPVELRDRIRRDVFALPDPDNREGFGPGQDLLYWLSGYADYRLLENAAADQGVHGGRYLDFGGSTGRVFRHFAIQSSGWDVWSCDDRPGSLEFNQKYFPKTMRMFRHTEFPSLPLPDAYFDLISVWSTFTHLDEAETGWLLELRRVLRVGGVACISIFSKETWAQMSEELRYEVATFRPDIADRASLPEGKTVVKLPGGDPHRCQVFHSDRYLERNWGRFFEIRTIMPLALGQESLVVCRRAD